MNGPIGLWNLKKQKKKNLTEIWFEAAGSGAGGAEKVRNSVYKVRCRREKIDLDLNQKMNSPSVWGPVARKQGP